MLNKKPLNINDITSNTQLLTNEFYENIRMLNSDKINEELRKVNLEPQFEQALKVPELLNKWQDVTSNQKETQIKISTIINLWGTDNPIENPFVSPANPYSLFIYQIIQKLVDYYNNENPNNCFSLNFKFKNMKPKLQIVEHTERLFQKTIESIDHGYAGTLSNIYDQTFDLNLETNQLQPNEFEIETHIARLIERFKKEHTKFSQKIVNSYIKKQTSGCIDLDRIFESEYTRQTKYRTNNSDYNDIKLWLCLQQYYKDESTKKPTSIFHKNKPNQTMLQNVKELLDQTRQFILYHYDTETKFSIDSESFSFELYANREYEKYDQITRINNSNDTRKGFEEIFELIYETNYNTRDHLQSKIDTHLANVLTYQEVINEFVNKHIFETVDNEINQIKTFLTENGFQLNK